MRAELKYGFLECLAELDSIEKVRLATEHMFESIAAIVNINYLPAQTRQVRESITLKRDILSHDISNMQK